MLLQYVLGLATEQQLTHETSTMPVKKQASKPLAISLLNTDQFSKIFTEAPLENLR